MIRPIKLKNGHTLEIFHDEFAESPREWDNLCKMICFHGRYNLGDKHDFKPEDYSGFEEMIETETLPSDIVVPLFLYDHGALRMATTPFHCPWDSGQVGYAVIPANKLVAEYGTDTPENRATARRVIEAEIETYNDYINDEVYGYVLKDENGEEIESCCGFYGYDPTTNGIMDSLDLGEEDVA